MNEKLGLYEELAANRAKYAWKEYIPPHDRVFRDAPGEPKKVAATPIQPPRPSPPQKTIRKVRARGATNKHAGPELDRRGRVSDIVAATADAFGVTVDDMLSHDRSRRVVYPRFAAMHVMFNVLRISLPSIGKVFNRDHTTCLYGVRQAIHLRRSDMAFAGKSRLLARELRRKWAVQ